MGKIWPDSKTHNSQAPWIVKLSKEYEALKEQEWSEITLEDLKHALKKSSKWKSPGKDKIPNFWFNVFHETHSRLTQLYNLIITDTMQIPQRLVNGITYLLPKSDETDSPKNCRPITCLTTMDKILTSILTEYTYSFLIDSGLFPDEQNGCKRGSYGCKDQLLINKLILENCHNRNTNLSIAWIDYKKAFDSVPHSWIEKCLETFKISPVSRNFISQHAYVENNISFKHCGKHIECQRYQY